MDRRTNLTKLVVAFHSFAKVPKNVCDKLWLQLRATEYFHWHRGYYVIYIYIYINIFVYLFMNFFDRFLCFICSNFVVSQLESRFGIPNEAAPIGVCCFSRPEFLVRNPHCGPAILPLYEHYQEMP